MNKNLNSTLTIFKTFLIFSGQTLSVTVFAASQILALEEGFGTTILVNVCNKERLKANEKLFS